MIYPAFLLLPVSCCDRRLWQESLNVTLPCACFTAFGGPDWLNDVVMHLLVDLWCAVSDLPNPNRVFNFKAESTPEKDRWMEALYAAGAGRD